MREVRMELWNCTEMIDDENQQVHWLASLASLASVMATPSSAQQQKPNVVFILADNVCYGGLGPYGGGELRGAPTPRIDQLANEGLQLTQ